MSKKPNNKMIGLFIICGIALFLTIIGMFVSQSLFSFRETQVVMYFSESIKGLNVGSPVVFKGVQIGKVAKIDIITDLEEFDFSIPVYVTFEKKTLSSKQPKETSDEILRELVYKGLRARLNTQNILTGQLMIELEILPDTPIVYRRRYHEKGDVPEIPTVLSQFAEISRGIQDIPLKETFDRINAFFENLNNDVVPKFNHMVEDLSTIPANAKSLPETMQSFNNAMSEISAAAKSFRNLTDYIERHPESILRGKGR